MESSVLAGTAIKALKQAAKMKHNLSARMLIPTLAGYTLQLKKCVHSDCASSQLLVSVLFIEVPTNTENSKIFLYFKFMDTA